MQLFFVSASVFSAQEVSLSDYVALVLEGSDRANEIAEQRQLAAMELATAEYAFQGHWVPIASLSTGSGSDYRSLGLEWQRQFESGVAVSSGTSVGRYELDETDDEYDSKLYIRLSQGLLRSWGQRFNRAVLTVAEYRERKDRLNQFYQHQQLILSAIQLYYRFVQASQNQELARKSFERAKRNLEVSNARQSVGLVSKSDVYRAELAMLNAQAAVENQELSWIRVRDDFHEQAGLNRVDAIIPLRSVLPLAPVFPEQWETTVLHNRSDWQMQLLDKQIANEGLFKAERGLLPDIELSLEVAQNYSGDNVYSSFDDETTWAVQLQLNSTFDRFSEKQALTRERIALARLERNSEALKRRIFREVRQAFSDLDSQSRQIQISQLATKQAYKAHELALLRYERGLTNNVDLVAAELELAKAEQSNLNARVGYNLTLIDLALALGVLDQQWLHDAVESKQMQERQK